MNNNISTLDTTSKTLTLTLTALFAAVLAAASWISVPLPFTPVPINLGTLAVTLTGALLGRKYGPLSVLVYILLGAVGIPVFAGFTGGLSHIIGPTGGYIAGYLTSSFICGVLIDQFYSSKTSGNLILIAAAAFLGTASCYIIGTIWFMHLTGNDLAASLGMCVIPFLPGDALKIAAAAAIVPPLKNALAKLSYK